MAGPKIGDGLQSGERPLGSVESADRAPVLRSRWASGAGGLARRRRMPGPSLHGAPTCEGDAAPCSGAARASRRPALRKRHKAWKVSGETATPNRSRRERAAWSRRPIANPIHPAAWLRGHPESDAGARAVGLAPADPVIHAICGIERPLGTSEGNHAAQEAQSRSPAPTLVNFCDCRALRERSGRP